MLDEIFKKIGMGTMHVKMYIALLEGGPSPAGNLAKRAGIPRSSLYGILYDLAQKGLVVQSERQGVKIWYAEQPQKIQTILDKEIHTFEETKGNLETLLPTLQSKYRNDLVNPHFQFFEGKDGIKHVLNDILLYENIDTESFWPAREMIEVLGVDFLSQHNKKRIKRNIRIRSIWPEGRSKNESADTVKQNPFIGSGEAFKRLIRVAPKGIKSPMGYWAYKNKVAFVSSKNEGFGFIIQSADFRKLLQTQFEVLWQLSKPLIVNEKHTKSFFETSPQKARH
ncbi:MAG: helix-turn-helix domain-containing protein [Patescibacteria group bacterium]